MRHERGMMAGRGSASVERAVAQARGTKPGAAAGSTGVKRRQALGKALARRMLFCGCYGGTEGATHTYTAAANGGGKGTPTPLFEVSVAEAEEVPRKASCPLAWAVGQVGFNAWAWPAAQGYTAWPRTAGSDFTCAIGDADLGVHCWGSAAR